MDGARLLSAVALMIITLNLGSAEGNISIVADLDSNAANGPDTLLIEPTDTVTVYLWFTGTDSVSAVGVTVGDTSGALSWIRDTTGAVYQ